MDKSDGYPAMFQHCTTVYEAMLEEGEPHEENEDYILYTGFTTHLFDELGLPVPYYTKIMRLLKDMDCVRQVRRGGSTTPSQWLLLQEPTMELFEEFSETETRTSRTAMIEQQLSDLRGMVNDHEGRLNRAGI